MCLVAPQHVGSSWTRARTHVSCIDRRILNHCATREVQGWSSLLSLPTQMLISSGNTLTDISRNNVLPAIRAYLTQLNWHVKLIITPSETTHYYLKVYSVRPRSIFTINLTGSVEPSGTLLNRLALRSLWDHEVDSITLCGFRFYRFWAFETMILDFNAMNPPLLTSKTPFLDRYFYITELKMVKIKLLSSLPTWVLYLDWAGHKPQGHPWLLPSSSRPNWRWSHHWHFYQGIHFPCHHTSLRLLCLPYCALYRHQDYLPEPERHFPAQKFFNGFPFPTDSRPKSSDSKVAQLVFFYPFSSTQWKALATAEYPLFQEHMKFCSFAQCSSSLKYPSCI